MLMSIGDYIRKRRKSLGLTQDDFAQRLKRTAPTVSQWETEAEPVPMDMLDEIARALEEPTPVRLYELAGILARLPGHKIITLLDGMSLEEVKRFEAMVEAMVKAYREESNH